MRKVTEDRLMYKALRGKRTRDLCVVKVDVGTSDLSALRIIADLFGCPEEAIYKDFLIAFNVEQDAFSSKDGSLEGRSWIQRAPKNIFEDLSHSRIHFTYRDDHEFSFNSNSFTLLNMFISRVHFSYTIVKNGQVEGIKHIFTHVQSDKWRDYTPAERVALFLEALVENSLKAQKSLTSPITKNKSRKQNQNK